jgi:hypothetical protein
MPALSGPYLHLQQSNLFAARPSSQFMTS